MANPTVFISYARKDGADESLHLYNELQDAKIGAWRDNRIDPTVDFTGEIEEAINNASHIAVIVTPDLKRADSFVRLEIGYALTQKKPIIPLMFPSGHCPIIIINHTYINFADWDMGFAMLLERIKNPNVEEVDPQTRREREIVYLQTIGQRYDHWRDLYTDMAATARIEEQKVKLKSAAQHRIEMRHAIYEKIDHTLDAEKGKIIKTENLDELREGIRKYRRVALIGDPGAGKTTTLERLAYEYAVAAVEETGEQEHQPLPLLVRLGAYNGEDFTQFLEAFFGGLRLRDYLPKQIVLLLDGLNEMGAGYQILLGEWLWENSEVSVVVSCRKLDYVERKLPLQRIDVAPLDLERIRLFLGNYLEDEDLDILFWALAGYDARRAWELYRTQKNDVTYREFFTSASSYLLYGLPESKILDKLQQDFRKEQRLPDMLGVVSNPFIMQIVIEIYALSGEPPRNKGDLFGRFVTLLMEERGKTAARLDRLWIAEPVQKRALAALAYRMQSEKTGTSISAEFVRETFQLAVPEEKFDLLLYFAVSANILEQSDTIRFSHQLLQEYFAAFEMGEDLKRGVSASKYFPSEDWRTATGWEETTLLLAGMEGDASQVVEWLTPIHPDLAYRVATESGTICNEKALMALYEPPLGARRSPYAVAEWGRQNHENDNRPGVGLRLDGLPDIAWCPIPASRFLYGNGKHIREISYDFKIAQYPITQQQFQSFIDSREFDNTEWWKDFPSQYRLLKLNEQNNPYRNHPQDCISWYQSVAFSRWLDRKYHDIDLIGDSVQIRLPTEEEWEYAARGTDGREYPWGNGYCIGHANINEQQLNGSYFLGRTTAVGLYPQDVSPFAVLDMVGNLYEWCLNDYQRPAITNGYSNGEVKVLRGGSFNSSKYYTTCTYRYYQSASTYDASCGLRLVLSTPIEGN